MTKRFGGFALWVVMALALGVAGPAAGQWVTGSVVETATHQAVTPYTFDFTTTTSPPTISVDACESVTLGLVDASSAARITVLTCPDEASPHSACVPVPYPYGASAPRTISTPHPWTRVRVLTGPSSGTASLTLTCTDEDAPGGVGGGATTSAAGWTRPTNTSDGWLVGCDGATPSLCPLQFEPLTGALTLRGPGTDGGQYVVKAWPETAGKNQMLLNGNVAGTYLAPTGNDVVLRTHQDGELYKIDAADTPLKLLTATDGISYVKNASRCASVAVYKNFSITVGQPARLSAIANTNSAAAVSNGTIVWAGTLTAGDYLEFYTATCQSGVFATGMKVLQTQSTFTLVRLDDVGSTAYGSLVYSDIPAAADALVTQSGMTLVGGAPDFTATSATRLTINTTGQYLLTAGVGIAFDRTQ